MLLSSMFLLVITTIVIVYANKSKDDYNDGVYKEIRDQVIGRPIKYSHVFQNPLNLHNTFTFGFGKDSNKLMQFYCFFDITSRDINFYINRKDAFEINNNNTHKENTNTDTKNDTKNLIERMKTYFQKELSGCKDIAEIKKEEEEKEKRNRVKTFVKNKKSEKSPAAETHTQKDETSTNQDEENDCYYAFIYLFIFSFLYFYILI
eukprot:GHVR01129116.1.p1 GENE.GHVR01129116.1~~GHVR01129116.1.p1  ORF type:complete len:205 (+),score=43.63 GHVR01129116.1:29-643(+)